MKCGPPGSENTTCHMRHNFKPEALNMQIVLKYKESSDMTGIHFSKSILLFVLQKEERVWKWTETSIE